VADRDKHLKRVSRMVNKEVFKARPGRPKKREVAIALLLETYAANGNLTESCRIAGVSRSAHYDRMANDPTYVERFEAANDAATDLLIAEARRRAVTGVEEPVGWYQGVAGGTIRRFSDNLLMFLVKERRPEFRDRFEISGSSGQPLQITVAAYSDGAQQQKKETETNTWRESHTGRHTNRDTHTERDTHTLRVSHAP